MDSVLTIGTPTVAPSRAGTGSITLASVRNRTVITHCRAQSPLRLLTPTDASATARVFAATYGGGLLAGDSIELKLDAGPATRTLLSTQASTKIYRSDGACSKQALKITGGSEAVIVSLPDPIVCFADSRFQQLQYFDLAPDASLFMLDWFTSGRVARGERWAMRHYSSRTQGVVGGRHVFRDTLELDCADGRIGDAMRMGAVNCFATAVLIGPSMAASAQSLAGRIQHEPIAGDDSLLFGASTLEGGAVIRVAGASTQSVAGWIRERFAFISHVIELDPWQRKW